MTDDAREPGLFEVEELVPLPNARRAEAGLYLALKAAERDGVIRDIDAGMVAAALMAARTLDRAEGLPDKTAVYAMAQALPPYQRILHGLRLPAEVAPVTAPPLPDAGKAGSDVPDWLSDGLGPS